ncbi:MAG: FHA domain-containing protein, partial [Planctomycetes bacterium]|nr:FHA domain-containing protein [Planctomycetota bacterium]
MSEDPPAQGMTQTPAYARGGGGTLPPAYAFGASPQTPVEGLISLLTLHELRERRTIALEAPTVFGRKSRLYRYPASMNRFSGADAKVLERLDYVRITGQDSRISRTHGVLDPASFTIRDLNSANGIRVNGALIGRTPGHPGP